MTTLMNTEKKGEFSSELFHIGENDLFMKITTRWKPTLKARFQLVVIVVNESFSPIRNSPNVNLSLFSLFKSPITMITIIIIRKPGRSSLSSTYVNPYWDSHLEKWEISKLIWTWCTVFRAVDKCNILSAIPLLYRRNGNIRNHKYTWRLSKL